MTANIIDELKWRKLVKDISNPEKILLAQTNQKGIYCGFDPTNDSLHLGNLIQILLLRRFALFGFQAIAVIGGATAMIGDPSGKSQERNLLSVEQLTNNIKAISKQLANLVNYQNSTNVSALTLIAELNLLEKNESECLVKLLKTPNAQQQNQLVAMLKKLPLPLQELDLDLATKKTFYQILNLNVNCLVQQTKLTHLSVSELVAYANLWSQAWSAFRQITLGTTTSDIKNIKILNNHDWLANFNLLTFFRYVGKDFNINHMLNKETVATRLTTGISYTEFSYMVLQGYDFYHLYKNQNCYLQSGGSDQWGNITAGIELIRKKNGDNHQAAGLTINLLTKANGEKFGKSEKGAIFLDAQKTSIYECYQFLFNQEDKDLVKLFAALTFLNKQQITFILNYHQTHLKLRVAQKLLAALVTIFIHQLKGYMQALKVTDALFKDQIKELTATEILAVFKDVPIIKQNNDQTLTTVLIANKICQSKKQVRDLLQQGAISVNGQKITDENLLVSKNQAINQQVTLIKKGKRYYYIIFHE